MIEVVSVKFKSRGKLYFFDPAGVDVQAGQAVVVSTSKGLELCDCVQGPHAVDDDRIVPPLRPVVRVATAEDLRMAEQCKSREKEALEICQRRIAEHGLEMKLVDVEFTFDGSKILFFFTADGRVDFRALVRDLASIFRTRIELRQVGVRDEAKMLGGIGMCGRPYCCHQFLEEFQPVSTKMAKTQNLSLNPTKISGCCGRLMCCLRYEEEAYKELILKTPKVNAFVETVAGYGNVMQVNLLRQTVRVRLDGNSETLKTCPVDEVAVIPGGRPKPGEPLPHLLELPERAVEAEEPELELDDWLAPPMFAEDTLGDGPSEWQQGDGASRHKGAKGKRQQDKSGKAEGQQQTNKSAGGKQRKGNRGKPGSSQKGKAQGAGEKKPQQKASSPTDGEAAAAQKKKGGGAHKPAPGKPKQKPQEGGKPKQEQPPPD